MEMTASVRRPLHHHMDDMKVGIVGCGFAARPLRRVDKIGSFVIFDEENRGFRLIGEANRVDDSPTSSIQTIYNAGMDGWNYVLQTGLYF
jgi:hypothetical protein